MTELIFDRQVTAHLALTYALILATMPNCAHCGASLLGAPTCAVCETEKGKR